MSGQPIEGAKREFFPQLTSVRFFAALIVILYHYDDEFAPYLPKVLQNLIEHGYIGVSFFFVLSGFILAANYYDRLLDKTVSKADFWWARFSRIYPLYILSIIVVLPRFFIPTSMDPLPSQAIYAHAHPFELFMVVVFALQSFAFPSGGFFNSPAWSISTEIFFYTCLPFLLPIINRLKTRHLLITIAGLLVYSCIGAYCYHEQIFTVNVPKLGIAYTGPVDFFLNQFVRMSFVTRLPEFLAGIIGFRIYREMLHGKDHRWLTPVTILSAIPFIGLILYEPGDNIINTVLYTGQVLGIPFFVFLLLSLIKSKSRIVAALKHPRWVLLGEASFALYLFHIPIKNAGQLVVSHVLHRDKNNVWFCLGLIAFSIATSIFLFHKIETPCRKHLAAWWKQR
ncbi:MAG: acyltransferase, partial [Armatimonadota bacterium]